MVSERDFKRCVNQEFKNTTLETLSELGTRGAVWLGGLLLLIMLGLAGYGLIVAVIDGLQPVIDQGYSSVAWMNDNRLAVFTWCAGVGIVLGSLALVFNNLEKATKTAIRTCYKMWDDRGLPVPRDDLEAMNGRMEVFGLVCVVTMFTGLFLGMTGFAVLMMGVAGVVVTGAVFAFGIIIFHNGRW